MTTSSERSPNGNTGVVATEAASMIDLGKAKGNVIAYVPTLNLLAVAEGWNVRLWSPDCVLRGKFDKHSGPITRIVNLYDDVMVSVDKNGAILTWKASSANVLDLHINEHFEFWTVQKLDDKSRFLVGVIRASCFYSAMKKVEISR